MRTIAFRKQSAPRISRTISGIVELIHEAEKVVRGLDTWSVLLGNLKQATISAMAHERNECRKAYVHLMETGIRDLLVSRGEMSTVDEAGRMHSLHSRWFQVIEAELTPAGDARSIFKCSDEEMFQLLGLLRFASKAGSDLEGPVAQKQRTARLLRDLSGENSRVCGTCYRPLGIRFDGTERRKQIRQA